jgi:hypothetical protein
VCARPSTSLPSTLNPTPYTLHPTPYTYIQELALNTQTLKPETQHLHPRVGSCGVTAAAAVGAVGGDAIDEGLRCEHSLWEAVVAPHVDSVAQRTRRRLRPA